jgi:hypothetical protein
MAHKGGHGYPRTEQIRKERRERADQVAAETGFSKLSTKDKLERVLSYIATPGHGEAKKQIEKLVTLLAKEHEKPADKPEKVDRELTPTEVEKPHNRKGKKGK